MEKQLNSTSATKPRPEPQTSDERFKLSFWLGKYETYLFANAPESTYERYGRALSRFYEHFYREKPYTYSVLRKDVEAYRDARLREGASTTTVAMELSIVKGFFDFMIRRGADGVMFNPVRGVKVKRPTAKRKKRLLDTSSYFGSGEPASLP